MQAKRLVQRNTLSAAITAALLAGVSVPALAQEQAEDEDLLMEEITVTATRRETSLADVPYNISAVTGDFIERSKIMTTGELLRGVPGAQVVDYGARNSGNVNTIKIRGLALDSAIQQDVNLSTASTVSTYVNDINR